MNYLAPLPHSPSDDLIRERFLARHRAVIGDNLRPSAEERFYVSERTRADYVCQIADRDGITRATALKTYAVALDVAREYVGELPGPQRKKKRGERHQEILDWAADNIELSITTTQVAELFEISNTTASRFLQDHPDVFRPLKRGHFQIRDPHADRIHDKTNTESTL